VEVTVGAEAAAAAAAAAESIRIAPSVGPPQSVA
jgi:hypothetical protein